MSTARFDTLQNAAGSKSVPVATVVDGSAKAWVNFNGTGTVAIRASFNVTSITDNTTGDYTVNLTTALTDASYSATLSSAVNSTTAGVVSPIGAAPTASALRIKTYGATFIATDSEFVYCTFHR